MKRVYTIAECCDILRYERKTIYLMIRAGVLKQTGRGRVQAASLEKFYESGMTWQEYANQQSGAMATARTGSTKKPKGTSGDSKATPLPTKTRNGQKLNLRLLKSG